MQTVGCRKSMAIVLGLLFTMKIPTTTCGVTAAPQTDSSPGLCPAVAREAPIMAVFNSVDMSGFGDETEILWSAEHPRF
jgi:hypothetical protein